MTLKFITALAWLWGGAFGVSILLQFIPPIKTGDLERAWTHFFCALPAFAWLIARYWMA